MKYQANFKIEEAEMVSHIVYEVPALDNKTQECMQKLVNWECYGASKPWTSDSNY